MFAVAAPTIVMMSRWLAMWLHAMLAFGILMSWLTPTLSLVRAQVVRVKHARYAPN